MIRTEVQKKTVESASGVKLQETRSFCLQPEGAFDFSSCPPLSAAHMDSCRVCVCVCVNETLCGLSLRWPPCPDNGGDGAQLMSMPGGWVQVGVCVVVFCSLASC